MNRHTIHLTPNPLMQIGITAALTAALMSGCSIAGHHLSLTQESMNTLQRVAIWGSVLTVFASIAIYAGRWAFNVHVQNEIQAKLAAIKSVAPSTPRKAMLSGQGPRYALEIRGIGLATENYFQDEVWNAIEDEKKNGLSILEKELSENPRTEDRRRDLLQTASESTFDYVGQEVVTDWPVPGFAAEPPKYRDDIAPAGSHISSRAIDTGLAYTYFLWEDDINADDASPLIARLFAFFDANPEVPEAVIITRDADQLRCRFAPREQHCDEGTRRPEVLSSLVTLLVSRTDRVDRYIRPYARHEAKVAINADQTEHDYIKQYLFYGAVEQEFVKKFRTEKILSRPTLRSDYWISQLPRLLKTVEDREDTREVKSPYLPLRWMTWQLKTFDKAPLLGYLHRPVTIRLRDEEGIALKGDTRAKALHAGWQTALASLPDGHLPSRVFHDRTNDGGLRRELSTVLMEQPNSIDLHDVDQGYDIGTRIGNTGISSPFVQIALATMAGYKTGKTAATVHRREDGDVMITMVSPPDEESKAAWEGESKRNPFSAHVPH